MTYTVFYAWQSDLPEKGNHYFIRDAAREAMQTLSGEGRLEDAPRLDHDTQEVPGTPDIPSTIFEKIGSAAMFLGDVSFVASAGKRRISNPNVLTELGYAASAVGWDRVILVMNTAFGPREDLPFDLKHRRFPITYDLPQDANNEHRKTVQKQLSKRIADAIKEVERSRHRAIERAIPLLDHDCLRVLMENFGVAHFHEPTNMKMRDALGFAGRFTFAARRLLEFGLVRVRPHPSPELDKPAWVYEWTYMGRLLLDRLTDLLPKQWPKEWAAVLGELADSGKLGDLDQAVALAPSSSRVHAARGKARVAIKDYPGAIVDFTKAIELEPGYAEGFRRRGVAHAALGDHRAAHADQTRALELDPHDVDALANRGRASQELDDLDGALRDYDEGLRLAPSDADLHYRRGDARRARGDLQPAIDDFERFLQLSPSTTSTETKEQVQRIVSGLRAKLGPESRPSA